MKLVADANVLLSAVLGGRAKAVLLHPSVTEVLVAETAMAEVQEYAPQLATKKRLALDIVLMTVATLPIKVVERAVYQASIADAKRRIGRRDPDDVETLALALHAGIAVWSNDNDFEEAGVEWSQQQNYSPGLISGGSNLSGLLSIRPRATTLQPTPWVPPDAGR